MNYTELEIAKANMVEVIKEMWNLGLANTTGIAVSCKVNSDKILSDRSGTGFRRCNISVDDLILIDTDCNIVEDKTGGRKAPVNTIIAANYYKQNELAKACVHCHATWSQSFAIANLSILPYTLQSKIIGEVPCVFVDDGAEKSRIRGRESEVIVPSGLHSRSDVYYVMEQVSHNVVETLKPRNLEMQYHGLGINHYEHGIFVFGRSLDEAFENLVRIEANAKQLLISFGSIIEVKKQYLRLTKGEIKSLNQF